MKTPLLVLVARRGDPSDSEQYAEVLRETFVGPQSAVPKELFQAAEFRESVFDATSPSLPSRY